MRDSAIGIVTVLSAVAFVGAACGEESPPDLLAAVETTDDTGGEADTASDTGADTDTGTGGDADSDADGDADTDADTDTGVDTGSEIDTDAELSCAEAFTCLISSGTSGLLSCLTGTSTEARDLMLSLGSCLVSSSCIGSGELYSCAWENCSTEVMDCMADS